MELVVEKREKLGKGLSALRKQGQIPAELYGHNIKNLHLAVDEKTFRKVFKEAGENTVVTLTMGTEKHPALIHDIQRDYIHGGITHVDFYEVRMDEKISAEIPLEFIGESVAIKEKGGILNKSVSAIKVEALPADLPHQLTVDISLIKDINESIRVKDLAVPKGVKVLVDPETAIATVTEKMAEEVAPAPTEAAAGLADVKVETEEKKAEREKEKTAETDKAAK